VNGNPAANRDALRNPECLSAIAAAVQERRPAGRADHSAQGPAAVDLGSATPNPRDEGAIRREATRIWCEVLDVDAADDEDDFSDLGGTSRHVMSLLRRVRLDLGVDVPVQEFVVRPTLRALVEAIGAAALEDSVNVPLLRAGQGRPLFLVGDAWGQVMPYTALVSRLDTDRPVYGLRLPMVDADGRHRTIPQIAQQTKALLRDVQPTGPYSLAGFSFGGLVAYELARALTADGAEVAYLGLIDVLPPVAALSPSEAKARRWARKVDIVLSGMLLPTLAARLRDRFTRPRVDSEEAFLRSSTVVANAYRPERYDGPVTYFQAEERLPLVGNLLPAWRRVAPHLFVTEVAGHHDGPGTRISVLAEQLADGLAARMSATLA
jgi:acetoacetyl-CoA synthetase